MDDSEEGEDTCLATREINAKRMILGRVKREISRCINIFLHEYHLKFNMN